MRRRVVVTTACIALLVPVSMASAKTFKGTMKGKDSTAEVTYHLTGKKISADVDLHFTCSGDVSSLDVRLETRKFKVRKGPAGGGFAIDQQFNNVATSAGTMDIDLGIAGGTRSKKIIATFDAYASDPLGDTERSINCDLVGNFTAKK